MTSQKPFVSFASHSQASKHPTKRYVFDALDWAAAFFIVGTPLYVACLLLGN
jgi:hypothetical protein